MQSNSLLQKVSDIILKTVPASRIILLAYSNSKKQSFTQFNEPVFELDDPAELQLFVMADVPNMDKHAAIDTIEQRCRGIIGVCIVLMIKKEFAHLLQQGNRFAISVMQSARVIYEEHHHQEPLQAGEPATNIHPDLNSWYKRGIMFLQMAKTHSKSGEYGMAGFCIHLGAEQFLCMLMQLSIGYRVNTHNLDRQLRLIHFYVPETRNVFCRETQIEKQRLQSLKTNFVHFMNKSEDAMGEEEVEDYLDELYRLQLITEGVFFTHTPIFNYISQIPKEPQV